MLFKRKKFNYRIDTFKDIGQMDLEDAINNIVSARLFEGRWRLHTIKVERKGDAFDALDATVICECEITQ